MVSFPKTHFTESVQEPITFLSVLSGFRFRNRSSTEPPRTRYKPVLRKQYKMSHEGDNKISRMETIDVIIGISKQNIIIYLV